MSNQNNRWKKTLRAFRKFINSTAVVALLLPNLMSVGSVMAEELPAEEPPIENIEEPTAETETVEQEEPAEPAQDLPDPQEVRVTIRVTTPTNMENYVNTLRDFTNHPLILTNQVTGEVFYTTVTPGDANTSNNFQLQAMVHNYERGNQPSGRYTITLPQELIDLGYSLTRAHSVQANQGIVGSTNLSYNAPQPIENMGSIERNIRDYDYFGQRDVQIELTSLDGERSYVLGSRALNIPGGEYQVTLSSPEDSRPNLVLRESSATNAPETTIPLTRDGEVYTGRIVLDFSTNTRTQVLKVSPLPLEVKHTVTIDPNGGTVNDEHQTVEIEDGETYTLPYGFQSGLVRPGYTLTGYTVEGTLLDGDGNEVTDIPTYSRSYAPQSNVTLTANWEVTRGTFTIRDHSPNFITGERSFALTDGETTYPLSSKSYTNRYREWRAENVPNGAYTLLIDGVGYPGEINFEKVGHPDTTSSYTTNDDNSVTFDLAFEDDAASTFIRYNLSVNTYPIGVEVRDVNNRRTADVGITVANEDGVVFEGSYNQYNQWFTETDLLPGTYTLTLDTPEGTVAEINDTVASQKAVATDEENVFTMELNAENQGNLSAVFAAFRLVEVPTGPIETHEDIVTTEPIGYETEYRNNPKLPVGERRVVQVGVEGVRTVTERVYYEDGVEVRREIIDDSTTPAVKEIIEVGTKVNVSSIVKKVVKTVVKVFKSIFGWFF